VERGLAKRIAEEVMEAMRGGPPVVVATVIAAPPEGQGRVGAKMLLRANGGVLGSLDGGVLDATLRREKEDVFRRRGTETLHLSPDGSRLTRHEALEGPSFQVLVEHHERPATLLIIGGGHIGKALAAIGHLCGFVVEVVDDRPEYANAGRFPEADRITCGRFDEVLRDYSIDPSTYIVCVTRGHRHDEVSLRQVVGSSAAYIGMIGSRRRVGAVLQHLVEDGAPPEAVARVHTPIGLDIGAETPEEIAVSIMAEIIRERRAQRGSPPPAGSARSMKEAREARHGVAPAERVSGDD
jgi:xanthine dehydrogenase accessory factor